MGVPARLDTALLGSGPGPHLRRRENRGKVCAMAGEEPKPWSPKRPKPQCGAAFVDAGVPCERCACDHGVMAVGPYKLCGRCMSRGLVVKFDHEVFHRHLAELERERTRKVFLGDQAHAARKVQLREQKAADARERARKSSSKQRDRAKLLKRSAG